MKNTNRIIVLLACTATAPTFATSGDQELVLSTAASADRGIFLKVDGDTPNTHSTTGNSTSKDITFDAAGSVAATASYTISTCIFSNNDTDSYTTKFHYIDVTGNPVEYGAISLGNTDTAPARVGTTAYPILDTTVESLVEYTINGFDQSMTGDQTSGSHSDAVADGLVNTVGMTGSELTALKNAATGCDWKQMVTMSSPDSITAPAGKTVTSAIKVVTEFQG